VTEEKEDSREWKEIVFPIKNGSPSDSAPFSTVSFRMLSDIKETIGNKLATCENKQIYFAVTHNSGNVIPDERQVKDYTFTAYSEESKFALGIKISIMTLIGVVGILFW
jgi:hypothetical protein